jgi:hypothetical protein
MDQVTLPAGWTAQWDEREGRYLYVGEFQTGERRAMSEVRTAEDSGETPNVAGAEERAQVLGLSSLP